MLTQNILLAYALMDLMYGCEIYCALPGSHRTPRSYDKLLYVQLTYPFGYIKKESGFADFWSILSWLVIPKPDEEQWRWQILKFFWGVFYGYAFVCVFAFNICLFIAISICKLCFVQMCMQVKY